MLIGNIEIDRAEVMSEIDWLADRPNFIGSSEAAALFGVGYGFMPSGWSVWADKTGKIPRDESDDDERMLWGQLLERPILEVVKRRTGWDVLFPMDVYEDDFTAARLRIRAPFKSGDIHEHLAATCDAFVLSHEDGLGLIEVKNRDFLQWRDEYTDDDAAARDQIQLAHQMICVPEASWGVIAVLVGGNDLKLYHYKREDLAQQMADIIERAGQLWEQIEGMVEPSVMDEREMPAWGRMHFDDPVIDVVEVAKEDWERFDHACRSLSIDDPMAKDLAKKVKAAKAVITGIVGKCHIANSSDWSVAIKTSQRKGSSISLPDKMKVLVEGVIYDMGLEGGSPTHYDDLKQVLRWEEVARRESLSRSFEATRLRGIAVADDDKPEDDIVERIRNTDLGG